MRRAPIFFLSFVFLFTGLLAGCASTRNTVPEGQPKDSAFEYCGGELWGYNFRLDGKPHHNILLFPEKAPQNFAVFLHLRSILEKNPEQSLTLHMAVQSFSPLKGEVKNTVKVSIDGAPSKTIEVQWQASQDPKRPVDLYPTKKYDIESWIPQKNEWKVTEHNEFFYLIKGESKIVNMPLRIDEKISGPFDIKMDTKITGRCFC